MKALVCSVLNYQNWKVTIDCLRSLEEALHDFPSARVIVTENGSGNDSARELFDWISATESRKARFQFLELPHNLGFAGGHARALQDAKDFEYFFVVNSDCIVRREDIAELIRLLEAHPDIAILGTPLEEGHGEYHTGVRRMNTPVIRAIQSLGLPWKMRALFGWANSSEEIPVQGDSVWKSTYGFWIVGAFLAIRKAWIERIGFLDPTFFFYGEDAEYSHRAQRSGGAIAIALNVRIKHVGGGTCKLRPTEWRKKALARADYLVQRKCYGELAFLFAIYWDRLLLGFFRFAKLLSNKIRAERLEDLGILCGVGREMIGGRG